MRYSDVLLITIKIIIVGKLIGQAHCTWFIRSGLSVRELVQNRGYHARDYRFTSPDGYKLLLTRVTNPLINNGASGLANRDPILLIHGILEDSSVFLVNLRWDRGGPQDFSKLNIKDPLVALKMLDEVSSKSFPYLALNFGHEVWFLNRRGYVGSQEVNRTLLGIPKPNDSTKIRDIHSDNLSEYHDYEGDEECNQIEDDNAINLDQEETLLRSGRKLKFYWPPFLDLPEWYFVNGQLVEKIIYSKDKTFWAFSFDQEAKFDIPLAISHILTITKRPKIATVTHSMGGGLLLMSLSLYPQLADKLAANVLWSPGFTFGSGKGFKQLLAAKQFVDNLLAPIPPVWAEEIDAGGFLWVVCRLPLSSRPVCDFFKEFFYGLDYEGKFKAIYPQFVETQFYPTSTRELSQCLQTAQYGGHMHFYDYGRERNKIYYHGKEKPPAYNIGAIKSQKLSFYTTPSDTMITPEDIQSFRSKLKVASRYRSIEQYINHVGYFFYKDNSRTVNIPTLHDIHSQSDLV